MFSFFLYLQSVNEIYHEHNESKLLEANPSWWEYGRSHIQSFLSRTEVYFPEQRELKSAPRDISTCRNGLVKPQTVQEAVRLAEHGGT